MAVATAVSPSATSRPSGPSGSTWSRRSAPPTPSPEDGTPLPTPAAYNGSGGGGGGGGGGGSGIGDDDDLGLAWLHPSGPLSPSIPTLSPIHILLPLALPPLFPSPLSPSPVFSFSPSSLRV
jgi:hypothetical protein